MPTNVFPQGFALSTLPAGYWAGERGRFIAPPSVLSWLPEGYWQGRIILPLMRSGPLRENGAGGAIGGTITLDGQGAARTVRIHDRASGLPVATLTSGADGSYSAGALSSEGDYYVVALPFANDGANAVISDRLKAV